MFYMWFTYGYLLIWTRILYKANGQICENCYGQQCTNCQSINCQNCVERNCPNCELLTCPNCNKLPHCPNCYQHFCPQCRRENCQDCDLKYCQTCEGPNCQNCQVENCQNCQNPQLNCQKCAYQNCQNCDGQKCQNCALQSCETCKQLVDKVNRQNFPMQYGPPPGCQECQNHAGPLSDCQNCQNHADSLACQNCQNFDNSSPDCQNCHNQANSPPGCQNCNIQASSPPSPSPPICQNCQNLGNVHQTCQNCYYNGNVPTCGSCQTAGNYHNCHNCTTNGVTQSCGNCQNDIQNCYNCSDGHGGNVYFWTETIGDAKNSKCTPCNHPGTGDKWNVDRDDRIIFDYDHGQVQVSSSAAASVKYPPPGQGGQPQAYISSLSSAKADPKIPVTVVDGVAVEQPKRTWGYQETPDAYGPENWAKIAPKCAGSNQSPINIVTANAIERNIESPISISMDDPSGAALIKGRLINNGKTIGFEVGPNSPPVRFTGEMTEGNSYVLKQFHMHFGCEGKKGSEHTIDGEKFTGELHLVFKNEKYLNPKVAMQQKDGLAILAFFLQARPNADPNPAFDKIANNIPNIQFAKQQLQLPGGLSIINLIPPLQDGLVNLKRYVYKGSLPTPPCYESVTWVVFNRAIGIQPNKFPKQVFGDEGTLICGNHRPQVELEGREVYKYSKSPPTTLAPPTLQTKATEANPVKELISDIKKFPTKSPLSKIATLVATLVKTMQPTKRTVSTVRQTTIEESSSVKPSVSVAKPSVPAVSASINEEEYAQDSIYKKSPTVSSGGS